VRLIGTLYGRGREGGRPGRVAFCIYLCIFKCFQEVMKTDGGRGLVRVFFG
jgi:hypothetical protein